MRLPPKSAITVALVAAIASGTASSAPQWSTDTAVNQVVSDAASDQNQPKVEPATDGGYWVSWFDGIGTGWDVRLQRFDIDGNAVFAPGGILVADRSFSSTQDYGLDVATNGDALLAFRDDRSGGVEITAARYAPDGTAQYGTAGVTLTNNVGFVASPRVTEAAGSIVVAWTENASVRSRVIDSSGTPTSVDQSWAPSSGSYSVADMRSGGGDAIISVVHATGGFSSPRHLLIQRLDPTGFLPWGIPLTPVYTAGSLQIGAFPKFTSNLFGDSFLTWYSSSPSLQCFAQFIDRDGTARWAPNGVPVATTPGVRVNPVLAQTGGTFLPVVVWREQNASQSQSGISAQRFNPTTGQRLWGDAGVSISPVGAQQSSSPGVIVDAVAQTSTITWEESPSFNADEIFAAIVDGTGSVTVPTFDVASTPSGKSRISTAKGLAGGSLTVWSDSRSDSGDILAQQLASDGEPGTLGIISNSVPICTVVPNSLGLSARTFVVGDTSAQANDNTLWTVDMPLNSFGLFIVSPTPATIILPSMAYGDLCLAGNIARFMGPGQVLSSGTTGSIQIEIDLTQQPTPIGSASVMAGEQWYYQTWYRDFIPSLGVVTNFSDACSVLYQ